MRRGRIGRETAHTRGARALLVGALVLLAGCAIDASDDVVDASDDADAFSPWLGLDAACANYGLFSCESGLQCVNDSARFCSSDWGGRCRRAPADCRGEPEVTICDCHGGVYTSRCQAKLAGFGGPLLDCSEVPRDRQAR